MENLDLSFENIKKVYVGRDSGCRCGCHGKYTYTSHTNPTNSTVLAGCIINDRRVKSTITRAKNLLENGEGKITDSMKSYVNISYGNDRAICFYYEN